MNQPVIDQAFNIELLSDFAALSPVFHMSRELF